MLRRAITTSLPLSAAGSDTSGFLRSLQLMKDEAGLVQSSIHGLRRMASYMKLPLAKLPRNWLLWSADIRSFEKPSKSTCKTCYWWEPMASDKLYATCCPRLMPHRALVVSHLYNGSWANRSAFLVILHLIGWPLLNLMTMRTLRCCWNAAPRPNKLYYMLRLTTSSDEPYCGSTKAPTCPWKLANCVSFGATPKLLTWWRFAGMDLPVLLPEKTKMGTQMSTGLLGRPNYFAAVPIMSDRTTPLPTPRLLTPSWPSKMFRVWNPEEWHDTWTWTRPTARTSWTSRTRTLACTRIPRSLNHLFNDDVLGLWMSLCFHHCLMSCQRMFRPSLRVQRPTWSLRTSSPGDWRREQRLPAGACCCSSSSWTTSTCWTSPTSCTSFNLLNFHYNMNYLNLVFLPTAWTSPTWSRLIHLHLLDPLRHKQSSSWTLPLLRFMSRLSLRAFVAWGDASTTRRPRSLVLFGDYDNNKLLLIRNDSHLLTSLTILRTSTMPLWWRTFRLLSYLLDGAWMNLATCSSTWTDTKTSGNYELVAWLGITFFLDGVYIQPKMNEIAQSLWTNWTLWGWPWRSFQTARSKFWLTMATTSTPTPRKPGLG